MAKDMTKSASADGTASPSRARSASTPTTTKEVRSRGGEFITMVNWLSEVDRLQRSGGDDHRADRRVKGVTRVSNLMQQRHAQPFAPASVS